MYVADRCLESHTASSWISYMGVGWAEEKGSSAVPRPRNGGSTTIVTLSKQEMLFADTHRSAPGCLGDMSRRLRVPCTRSARR